MLSVFDVKGHVFNMGSDDSNGTETCFTCGGTWAFVDVVTDPVEFPKSVSRTYSANDGDAPSPCSGDTGRVHGDAPCQNDNGRGCEVARESFDGLCGHMRHDCNCVYCM